ncbi:MAG: aminotransferase class V-fold PLP-dependent enzyme [Sciscionella sp.]
MRTLPLSGFPDQGLEPARILRELKVIDGWRAANLRRPRDIARPIAATFVGVRADSDSFTRNIEADLKQTVLEVLCIPDAECFLTGSGTESNLLGLFAARQAASRDRRTLLGPDTLHTSVHKCAAVLDVCLELVGVESDRRVSASSLRKALTDQVFAIVASAPNWESGVWDPITEIGALASERQTSFHVDACIGGFLLPFLPRSGCPLSRALPPGVSSLALDLHKFGYAPYSLSALCFPAKGAPARAARIPEIGNGAIPQSLASDRPFWPIAAAWAVTKMLGRAGYERLAETLIARRAQICDSLAKRGLKTAGDPCSPIVRIRAAGGLSLNALQHRFERVAVPHMVCESACHIRLRVDPVLADSSFAKLLLELESL